MGCAVVKPAPVAEPLAKPAAPPATSPQPARAHLERPAEHDRAEPPATAAPAAAPVLARPVASTPVPPAHALPPLDLSQGSVPRPLASLGGSVTDHSMWEVEGIGAVAVKKKLPDHVLAEFEAQTRAAEKKKAEEDAAAAAEKEQAETDEASKAAKEASKIAERKRKEATEAAKVAAAKLKEAEEAEKFAALKRAAANIEEPAKSEEAVPMEVEGVGIVAASDAPGASSAAATTAAESSNDPSKAAKAPMAQKLLMEVLESRVQAAATAPVEEDPVSASKLSLVTAPDDPNDPFVIAAKRSKLFGQLPVSILTKMGKLCTFVTFQPGDKMIVQDELPDHGYLVVEGHFHLYLGANNNFRLDYGPGEVIGERTILNNLPAYTTDIVINEGVAVTAYKMTKDLILKGMQMQGDFNEQRMAKMLEMNEFLMHEVLA